MTSAQVAIAGVCGLVGAAMAPVMAILVERIPALRAPGTAPAWTHGVRVPTGVIATVTAAGFLAAALRWPAELRLVPHLLLVAALVVASAIDVEHARLPDQLVFPTLTFGGVSVLVVALVERSTTPIANAALGAVLMSGVLFAVHLVHKGGMGRGDVKLALVLGLFLGWAAPNMSGVVTLVLAGLFLGSLFGTVTGLAVAAIRRRNTPYPFGPSLALGTFIVLLASRSLVS